MTLKGHRTGLFSIAFSPDGKRIISGDRFGTEKLWDVASGQELLTFTDHTGRYVAGVAFSPDGRLIASVARDGEIKIRDAGPGFSLANKGDQASP